MGSLDPTLQETRGDRWIRGVQIALVAWTVTAVSISPPASSLAHTLFDLALYITPAILAVSLFHSARTFYARRDVADLLLAAVTAGVLALLVFLLMFGYLADLFWEPFG